MTKREKIFRLVSIARCLARKYGRQGHFALEEEEFASEFMILIAKLIEEFGDRKIETLGAMLRHRAKFRAANLYRTYLHSVQRKKRDGFGVGTVCAITPEDHAIARDDLRFLSDGLDEKDRKVFACALQIGRVSGRIVAENLAMSDREAKISIARMRRNVRRLLA